MGEARRRGTREERVAQAVVRRAAWDKHQAEERDRLRIERRRIASERQKLLTPQERKEAVILDSHSHSLLLAAALAGLNTPIFAVPTRRP